MTDQFTVAELMASSEWPTILRKLTDLLDTEKIGGVTTAQIEEHMRSTGTLREEE